MKNPKRTAGFTILELMIVVTLVGILSTIALPAIGDYIKNSRIKSQMYNLLNGINQARTEAVKRKETVTICRTNDLATPSCSGTSNTWTTGWLVFEDTDADGTFDAADDTEIASGVAASGTVVMKANANYLIYNPDGTRRKDDAGNGITRFAICDERAEAKGRQINVTAVGRANLYSYPIDDCDSPTGP